MEQKMVKLNIAYDFDQTLEDAMWGEKNPIKHEVQNMCRMHVKKGHNVFIITRRYGSVPKECDQVKEFALKAGIPENNVIFTDRLDKLDALKRCKIDLFLEDEIYSLNLARKMATFTEVVSVFKSHNNGVEWNEMMSQKEEELVNRYKKRLSIGGDHGGFDKKSGIKGFFEDKFSSLIDYGCNSEESCDYPDYAHKVAQDIQEGKADLGFLFCSTGQGMAMTANKYSNVRAALCWDGDTAHLARAHNNANVLCIPSKKLSNEELEAIVHIFLTTNFEGGRHRRRVEKICA